MTAILGQAWQQAFDIEAERTRPVRARKRRADIRAALTESQQVERASWIEHQIREADCDAEMAVIDAERLGHDDTESCVHCSALSRASQLRTVAARWTQILNGTFESRPYQPAPQMEWCPDTQDWALTEADERLPEFESLDVDAMRPEVAQRLVRIVSDARNWVWEPAGVETPVLAHVAEMIDSFRIEVDTHRDGTPIPTLTKEQVKSTRLTTNARFNKDGDPMHKVVRTYPGAHFIPASNGFARTAILTIWSERKGWCVYHCEQGPKRGRFDTWIPLSWWHDRTWARTQKGQPVQISVTDEFYESYISDDVDRLERALEIAYLKDGEVRSWMGEMAPFESPLPFSPDRLTVIGDAQANEFERQRVTSEPADD